MEGLPDDTVHSAPGLWAIPVQAGNITIKLQVAAPGALDEYNWQFVMDPSDPFARDAMSWTLMVLPVPSTGAPSRRRRRVVCACCRDPGRRRSPIRVSPEAVGSIAAPCPTKLRRSLVRCVPASAAQVLSLSKTSVTYPYAWECAVREVSAGGVDWVRLASYYGISGRWLNGKVRKQPSAKRGGGVRAQ